MQPKKKAPALPAAPPTEGERQASERVRQRLDGFFRQLTRGLQPSREPRHRWWEVKVPGGGSWRFAWTVERSTEGKRRGFLALAGKWSPWTSPQAPGQSWSRAEDVPEAFQATAGRTLEWSRRSVFASRWRAKDRAWKWRCQKAGAPFTSLHTKPQLSQAERERRAALLRIPAHAVSQKPEGQKGGTR